MIGVEVMFKKIITTAIIFLMIGHSSSVTFAAPPYMKSVAISGEEEIVLYVGETTTLEAIAEPMGPSGWEQAYIKWVMDKEGVIELKAPSAETLLSPPVSNAQITALATGEVTVTVYADLWVNTVEDSDASDSIKITVVDPNVDKMYNISYYTDVSYFNDGIEGKITSYEELTNQFPNCEKILSKYNEAFFENKFLYRIGFEAPDPAWDVRVTSVTDTQDSISIEVSAEDKAKEGYDYPDVIVPWDIILEFDNSHIDKTVSAKVKREKYVDAVYDEAFGRSDVVFIEINYHPCDKVITVGDAELYYNSQKDAYFGFVDPKNIDTVKNSAVIAISNGTPTAFTYGNLVDNGRDEVNMSDLYAMKLIIEKNILHDDRFLIASDLNGDGQCNITDFQAMKQYIEMGIDFPVLN